MRMLIVILAVLLLPLGAKSASAQQYQQWNNPDNSAAPANDARLRDFTERLNGLIDKAEKDRAADPRFLQDLRDLAIGTNTPSSRQLLSDDFGDGDFTHNPVWTVAQGKYWVEKGWGLRSTVKKQATQEPQRRSGKDAAAAIFGQILQQAIDPDGKSGSGGSTSSAGTPAAIRTAVPISNAFKLEMEFSSWVAPGAVPGRLEIAVYQNTADYILAYQPGGAFELVRASPRGANVIDSRTGPSLENKKTHHLVWTRQTDGQMRVAIDGEEILTTNDRSTAKPFDGLRIVNRGGDYIIKRIAVTETR
ncbi:MAG: hypothetical protein O3B76_04025 [Proteobacteria bacterium]|nr:hypothetical protein [Pseudomonadota bacterium]MDA1023810.1 hypothetical protein [Pseudomonadota bacterium]